MIVVCAGTAPHMAIADIDYFIERPVTKLSLEYQDKDESRSGPGIDPRSEEAETFWQRLEVRSRGWLYHPDLLVLSFGIEPQWKQQDTTATNMFARDDDSNFLGYFLDAQILRQKTHSFNIFLQQSRNEFNSTLSPDNITEVDVSRAAWLINSGLLRTKVTIERNKYTFEDFFTTIDDSDVLRLESQFSSDKHQLNVMGEYLDQLRRVDTQEFNIERYLVSLNSNYTITNKARLSSTIFNLDSESEVSDSKSFLWSESLTLQHRANLKSQYTARFDSRENENFRSDARFLSASLEHLLYENLTTRFELYANNDDFDDGEEDVSAANLDFRYIRKIPVGVLTVTNAYEYRIEDNNVEAKSSQVFGETHTLMGSTPELLSRARIELDSVIVTDSGRTTTYIEGIDYVLNVIGSSVTIERLLFGGIADGENVLVDYVYATQAPFEADRTSARFGVNLNLWRVLRLHYDYSRIKEDLVSGIQPFDLADDIIQRVGATLHWRWSTTTAEYESRDTVRTPLNRRRFQQAFMFRVKRSLSLGVSAGYAETEFDEEGSDTRTIDYAGNLRWDAGSWGRLEVSALSRDIDGASQITKSYGLISKWSVRYGDWSGFVRYEDLDQTDDLTIQSRDRRLITLHIARTFR